MSPLLAEHRDRESQRPLWAHIEKAFPFSPYPNTSVFPPFSSLSFSS